MPRAKKPKGPKLLASAIEGADLKQVDAATLAGIRAVDLSRFLNARRVPTLPQAARLKDVFGVPMRSWVA